MDLPPTLIPLSFNLIEVCEYCPLFRYYYYFIFFTAHSNTWGTLTDYGEERKETLEDDFFFKREGIMYRDRITAKFLFQLLVFFIY